MTKKRIFTQEEKDKIIKLRSKDITIIKIAKNIKTDASKIVEFLKEIDMYSIIKRDCSGKNNGFYGKKHSNKTIKNMIKERKGKKNIERFGEERAKEISIKIKTNRKKKSNTLKGKTYDQIHGKKKAKKLIEKRKKVFKNNKPREWTEEQRKERSELFLTFWKDPEYRERTLKSMLHNRFVKPSTFEKKISNLCIENNLPFIYVGNGKFFIGRFNPDFIDEQRNLVIEVFYSYHKIELFGSVEKYKEDRIKYFRDYGWEIIFLDENDVDVRNWKEICLKKIKEGMIKNAI